MHADMISRFEQTDKRIDETRSDMNQRFETARADTLSRFEQVDKRIDETRSDMNQRFQQVDKRIDETRSDMNLRFEQVDKRFNRMTLLITTGFAMLTILMSVYKFIQ